MKQFLLWLTLLVAMMVPPSPASAYERSRPRWRKCHNGRIHAVVPKIRRHIW